MSEIFLDDILYHLYYAEKALDGYEDIDPYLEIFEAEDPAIQSKVVKNAESKKGVIGHLQAAGKAIINFITNIINSITDFFRKQAMTADEKAAYEKFKEAAAKDPSLKNKKITVVDYRKLNEQYQQLLKEIEEAEKSAAEGREYPTDTLMNKITNFCKNGAEGVMVAVGCEAALNFASSSREGAQVILNTLKKDKELEEKLMKSIGKYETKKFERQMRSLGKRYSWTRHRMRVKGHMAKSLEDAISNTISQVNDLCKSVGVVKNIIPENDPSKSGLANGFNTVKTVLSKASKNNPNSDERDAINNIKNNLGLVRRIAGNEEIRNGVGTISNVVSSIDKNSRDYHKAKTKKKNFKIHDQSLMDAIVGINDPNSTINKR